VLRHPASEVARLPEGYQQAAIVMLMSSSMARPASRVGMPDRTATSPANSRWRPFTGWGFPVKVAFSNLYPDIHTVPFSDVNLGIGVPHVQYELANSVSSAHRLEMPGGTFTKSHRYDPRRSAVAARRGLHGHVAEWRRHGPGVLEA